MNAIAWAGRIRAPLVIAAGLFTCFCGYRILKLTLGILGFIAGAEGGWAIGLSLAHGNSGIALLCAIIVGAIGAALCVWLFFLGIFLLGASAGAIVGAALFSASGNQPQPILLLVMAIVFGVIALIMQKFMIIVSTAFSGSYLVTTEIWHLLAGDQSISPLWFVHLQPGSAGWLSYAAFAFWLVLGLAGMSVQYRAGRRRDEDVRPEAKAG